MWMPLKTAYPDKVTLTVREDHAFVHSKMILVDDIWALIGSANIGYRSFTSDPEIGAAVVDERTISRESDKRTVTKFAHDVRIRSWAEHANVTPEAMRKMNVAEGIDALKSKDSFLVDRENWDTKVGRALGFIDSDVIQRHLCSLSDPDGQCKE